MSSARSPLDEWTWEGNVQRALTAYLRAAGWDIESEADTASRERGVDVVATRQGRRLAVEVKGYPSGVYVRGDRQGQPKRTRPSTQTKHWFAKGLHAAVRTRSRLPEVELALAFPDVPQYRALIGEARWALDVLGIGVYLVREDGDVVRCVPHRAPRA